MRAYFKTIFRIKINFENIEILNRQNRDQLLHTIYIEFWLKIYQYFICFNLANFIKIITELF